MCPSKILDYRAVSFIIMPGDNRAMSENGIFYIASGKEHVEEALTSAKSVKNHNNIDITLITDSNFNSKPDCIDEILELETSRNILSDKPFNIDKYPYQKNIYLDTDTTIKGDITEIFEILDEFDVALAHNDIREYSPYPDPYPIEGIPSTFPEYNGGVICFRDTSKTNEFLSEFQSEYWDYISRGYWRDQPALRHALYTSDVRIATLPREYNCRFHIGGYVEKPVKIFHGRHRKSQDIIKEINRESRPRVYIQKGKDVKVVYRRKLSTVESLYEYLLTLEWRNDLKRLRKKIARDGVGSGLRAAARNLKRKL